MDKQLNVWNNDERTHSLGRIVLVLRSFFERRENHIEMNVILKRRTTYVRAFQMIARASKRGFAFSYLRRPLKII